MGDIAKIFPFPWQTDAEHSLDGPTGIPMGRTLLGAPEDGLSLCYPYSAASGGPVRMPMFRAEQQGTGKILKGFPWPAVTAGQPVNMPMGRILKSKIYFCTECQTELDDYINMTVTGLVGPYLSSLNGTGPLRLQPNSCYYEFEFACQPWCTYFLLYLSSFQGSEELYWMGEITRPGPPGAGQPRSVYFVISPLQSICDPCQSYEVYQLSPYAISDGNEANNIAIEFNPV